MHKHKLILLAGGLAVLAGGLFAWRELVINRQDQRHTQTAKKLIERGRAVEALGVLRQSGLSEKSKELERAGLVALGDTARLAALWRLNPESVSGDEQAAALAARGLLQSKDTAAAERLIAAWKPKAKHPAWWLCLRADGLLAQHKPAEAKKLLTTSHFDGPDDAGRLLRLALLCKVSTPEGRQEAWAHLEKAMACAPKDPDVRSFRGQLLEAAGRVGEARVEYVAAHLAAPRSPIHCDLLGEFYRRRGEYTQALATWDEGQWSSPADFLRVRSLFWHKMALPAAPTSPKSTPLPDPAGPAQALAHHLATVPANKFFDHDSFNGLPEATAYAERYPEVIYLELTQCLQDGTLGRAATLLGKLKGAASWNPALERGLAQLLRRQGQSVSLPTVSAQQERHPYFVALDAGVSADPALERLLKDRPHALAAAYLAGGWWEAALRLAPANQDLSSFPDWYAYGMAQALRENRGNDQALQFVTAQSRPSAALRVTQAELLFKVGKQSEALAALTPLAALPEPAGYRAACLKALTELEQGQAPTAEQTIQARQDLRESPTGKELLARIALGRKDTATAERLYRQIASQSLEAQTFLARQAFAARRWDEAERWTRQMLATAPDLMPLRENLAQIAAARKASGS
ncbi:tetratricopeptide repeat protein [Armatimonas rosea]|uniref:Putative Zn-dependent protease n=1 Tax=Armatimonas rosea TaxID=685828 RepID=A0A7W9SMT5_ARMRO|nr:hypothetical protein [Armatimonas rosea]MBB6048734.1 putative Zn-dependent protease [Armatimonas rosea]